MSKKCPFCAELIHEDAIKCKHCGSYLVKSTIKRREETVKIFGKNATSPLILFLIIISIISIWLWYLTIPIIIIWYTWKKPEIVSRCLNVIGFGSLDKKKKWIITGLTVCIFSIILSITAYAGRTPNITITEPENNVSVQADSITIKGSVKPKYSKITINRYKSSESSINKNGNFTYTAQLTEEKNQFVFTATNNKNKKEASITINRIFTEEEKAQIEAKKQAAIDEANKKKQEEADQKEAMLQDYAQRYCDKRKEWYRKFPIIEANDKEKSADFNNGIKGINLKIQDCRNTINAVVEIMETEEGEIKKDVLEKIIEHTYWIGMNEYYLFASVGVPNDINKTTLSGYESKQYVYNQDNYGIDSIYIYIENGKVTSYQN